MTIWIFLAVWSGCVAKVKKKRIVPVGQAALNGLRAYLDMKAPREAANAIKKPLFISRIGSRLTDGVFGA